MACSPIRITGGRSCNSLLLAALVGVGGTVLGFLFAYTAARAGIPRGSVAALDAATLLPLVSPPFTTAIAMIFSFGPRGLITYHVLGIRAPAPTGCPAPASRRP